MLIITVALKGIKGFNKDQSIINKQIKEAAKHKKDIANMHREAGNVQKI